MSQQLINHSADLKRLRDEGYSIQVKGGYLVIHHIPYVNSSRQIKYGILASTLSLASNILTAKPDNHVIYFIGEQPCNKDGSRITAIEHSAHNQPLSQGLIANRSFSNKPAEGYADYYHKVSTYAEIISAPAKSLDSNVTAKAFNVVADEEEDSVFQYLDTNSSRANINQLNNKLKMQKIAIVGLGGTGAYTLDLLAKTTVSEIHLFDGDDFLQHNAFRSPGAASAEQLNMRMQKVDFYVEQYSKMHKYIIPHDCYVTENNLSKLATMSFVFLCIDSDNARKKIIQFLLKMDVPFIDVGLGVNLVDNRLIGSVRTTTGTPSKNDHLIHRLSFADDADNEYNTNIQIAELNALNACHAVIKWKKLRGFYQDLQEENHCIYSINVAQLLNEDSTA